MTSGSFSLICKHFPVNFIMILTGLFLNLSPNCSCDGSTVMKQICKAYNFFFCFFASNRKEKLVVRMLSSCYNKPQLQSLCIFM